MTYKRLNMAEMFVSDGNDVLAIHGLGSCLGIAIYDPTRGIGAMAHIMLPCNLTKSHRHKPGKYVDSAIDEMFNDLKKLGCDPENLVAKICGGSRMFKTRKDNRDCVGTKNIKLARKILKELGIHIIAEDVGGNYGRIVEFDVNTGIMRIVTVMTGTKYI